MMQALIPRIHAWWLMCLATVITITIVAASQLFTQRISILLDRQASELLAADLLIQSNEPITRDFQLLAQDYGLSTASTITLRSAIFINDEPQLVELKAVSDEYPLRGTLEKKSTLLGTAEKSAQGPKPGELWLDSKIADQVNQTIELGMSQFNANWIIGYEPDRGGSLFNMAPRILIHLDDLDGTGLLVAGSRAKYYLLVAGDTEKLEQFEREIKPLLVSGQSVQTLDNARPEMRNALDRTRKFFSLSIVLTLVIAMIAIAITARYAASQESTRVAVMRTFGISTSRLLSYFLGQVGKIWLWSLPFGLLGGFLAQFPLQWALGFWFGTRLPETNIMPYWMAAGIGLISLVGFSLPHILNVLDTPPMQVLRNIGQKTTRLKSVLVVVISLITLLIVLMLIVQQLALAAMLFALVIVIAGFIPLMLKLIIHLLQRFNGKHFWLSGYLFSRLLSQQRNALFVMSGFSLTLFAILLISQVKDQLLYDWERQLPQDKPNYFLVNIPLDKVTQLKHFIELNQIPSSNAYAMVRTRLMAINGQDVKQMEFKDDRARHLIDHTFNLSYSENLPPDNAMVEGTWFIDPAREDGFSVELGMAQKLGLKLGDSLQFSIAGSVFDGEVKNIRSVVWENFQPNFYILGTHKQLRDKPQTWMMSAFINNNNKHLLKPLLQQFPTVTLLDISEIMTRIKGIIQRAGLALEFFFLFAILSGVIVLMSALNTANHEREMEIALLQALGASHRNKLGSQLFEFLLMGLLVGSFAAFFANMTGWAVGRWFFDLNFNFSFELWLYSIISASFLITLVGIVFIYRTFSISPMKLLRS